MANSFLSISSGESVSASVAAAVLLLAVPEDVEEADALDDASPAESTDVVDAVSQAARKTVPIHKMKRRFNIKETPKQVKPEHNVSIRLLRYHMPPHNALVRTLSRLEQRYFVQDVTKALV